MIGSRLLLLAADGRWLAGQPVLALALAATVVLNPVLALVVGG